MAGSFNELIPIIGIICTIGLPITLGAYLALITIRARYRERMELIKQGIVPQERTKPTPNKYRALRNGFLCIGIALGLIIGFVATQVSICTEEAEALIIGSSVLLFLGVAYVLFYFATNNKKDIDSDIE